MGIIEAMRYALQVEFLDFRERGLYCQLFIEENVAKDGKPDWRRVKSTSPQPANLRLCLGLLTDIGKFHEIPEYELVGLTIQLETAFRTKAEEERKKIITADPLTTALVEATPRIIAACEEYVADMKRRR